MAKVSDYSAASTLTGAELIPIVQGGVTKKTTVADILAGQAEFLIIAVGDNTTAITTGAGKMEFYMPFAFTMTSYRATLITAGTGSALIVDINKNGTTTMTTNKLSIDATEKISDTAATPAAITTTSWASGDICTIDVDQVGTGAAGLQVTFYGTRVSGMTPGNAPNLDDLADVIITTPATGNVVRYNGSAWVNYPDSNYLSLVAGGASVENVGAIESNVQTVAAAGSTETLDTSLFGVFDITMDQSCTFTFSNPAPSGKATIFTLILRGAFTPTWPASVKWADATLPTYTTPSMYVFTTVDAGTIWLGSQAGKAYA